MNEEKKNQLIESIKTADGLTDDQRSFLLELLREKKPYGLVWEENSEDVENELCEKLPVLVEDKKKALTDGGPDAPNHVLIEGDNLEALTTLAYTHAGKIDAIYIDPPYNTGNRDFIYNDSYVDSEDSYRHSKWLSFMFKRLVIAKKLLSDRGVICISIDDNEQANLKLLCDEVFGERNFVSLFIWKSRQNKDNRNITGVSIDHEYVLCYSKTCGIRVFKGAERKTDQYSNPDNDPRGPWTSANMVGLLDEKQRPNCHYDLIDPSTGINYGKPKMGWRYDRNTMNRLIEDNRIIWPEKKTGRPRKKSFLSEISLVLPGFSSIIGNDIYTRNGTKQLDEIFGSRPFGFPKPSELIKQIVYQSTDSNSTVLDFFAGSGTTLHAVMQLNSEDGGHRQCILVTNNENGICENVTYERNLRVIKGYIKPNGDNVDGLHENNLRYYRTSLVDKDNEHSNRRNMLMSLTDVLCVKEDIYHEDFQFGDLSLSGKSKMLRYFAENDRKMLIIYDSRVIKFIVNEIGKQEKTETPIKIFIYADGMYPYTEDFKGVLDKVELIPMPYAFTHAIKGCIPEAEDKRVDQTELSQQEQDDLLIEAAEAEKQDN